MKANSNEPKAVKDALLTKERVPVVVEVLELFLLLPHHALLENVLYSF
jgi:hypothetical protein